MAHTTVSLAGIDKETGEPVIVPVGARLLDIYQATHLPCLDSSAKPRRFMALAHVGGRRVRVAVDASDFR